MDPKRLWAKSVSGGRSPKSLVEHTIDVAQAAERLFQMEVAGVQKTKRLSGHGHLLATVLLVGRRPPANLQTMLAIPD